jgi:hypothetical protein
MGPKSTETYQMLLNDLLITTADLPAYSWGVVGPSSTVIDRERSSDLAAITFFSDLYPEHFGSGQEVYRYDSDSDAKQDYEYAVREFGNGYVPSDWKYQSSVASQSQISCTNYPNVSFPVCYWVARYGRVVIDFTAWLIPGRMTLNDMQNIIEKIDVKASKYGLDNP